MRERRKAYFANQFECVKGDIKWTWSLINNVIKPNVVTKSNVLSYINSLKNKKCSVDCLPSIVLKRISYIVASVLSHLINLSLNRGIFPDCLKLARVVPLFKGGDSAKVSNYRPISFLNIISKILEKHAFRHLYSYFESRSIISESQFGFRYGRGTTQVILNHCSYIYIGIWMRINWYFLFIWIL